jgi:hypothetical protein
MEVERDHVLGAPRTTEGFDDDLIAAAQRSESASDELDTLFEALSATAEFDQAIFDGASFGTPVLAGKADQVAADKRRAPSPRESDDGALAAMAPRTTAERRILLRKQLNALVAAHHHRTALPHGKIHAELRRICGGPPSAQATIEQLEARIATIHTL